jgi:hypothetical protein
VFLKKTFWLVLLVSLAVLAYGRPANTLEPKEYVLENLKYLDSLIQKKKSAKTEMKLEIIFDEYADDAKKLLEVLDKQNSYEQQDVKKEDIVKQIAHSMAVLQRLLEIMKNNQLKPLETYCNQQRSDALWGSLCGDRPTKRVRRDDSSVIKKTEVPPSHVKIRYAEDDNDEMFQPNIGSH